MKRLFALLGILAFFCQSNLSFAGTGGSIVAWGYNQYDQCTIPFLAGLDSNYTAITAGSFHSIALHGDGRIVPWGWNYYNQSSAPSTNLHFTSISAGGVFTVGLKADGKILGVGHTENGELNQPDPNFIYSAVSAGNYHTVALKTDGVVVAWGLNANHQCDVPEPNSGFVAVAAGYIHSLALKSDGSVVAWGDNSAGQCDVPSPNKDFIAVAGGGLHSLGLKTNGSIVAWGDNNDHQCRVPAPNTNFVAIDAGFAHSLGIRANGSIRAWGDNTYHQRDVCAPNSNFIAIAGGSGHSLALRSPCDIPSRPTGVSASDGRYADHIRVSWNHVSGAHTYEVWRSPYNVPASAIKLADSNSPYNDYNVPSDSKLYYWVKAVSPCGESFFSRSNSGYTALNPVTDDILVKKCTVFADKSDVNDSISISGFMNAGFNDVDLSNSVEVNISSDDLNVPCVLTFPIDSVTFRKGRLHSHNNIGSLKTSFTFDTKTLKFSFAAKKINLSGLACPFTIQIKVGSFIAVADVNETIVNGRRPIPINLLTGIKNSLRVDRFRYYPGYTNTAWLSARGGFSVFNPNANMADSNFVIALNDQTFTIPAGSFRQNGNAFSFSKLKLSDGSIASASFNFKTCAFRLRIRKADIIPVTTPIELSIAFSEFNETADVP